VTTEYQAMSGSDVRDVVESPERSVNRGPKASAEMPPRSAHNASAARLQPSADELTRPQRWQPSGYVNPYRLPPYQFADIYEELTAVDCWPNELNELARHTLINIVVLLFGVIVMSVFITLYAVAAAHDENRAVIAASPLIAQRSARTMVVLAASVSTSWRGLAELQFLPPHPDAVVRLWLAPRSPE
jgi:hypothetical protein